jgi:hypothetical protein
MMKPIENQLRETIESLEKREDFVYFLKLLHNDVVLNKHQWENTDLPSFLEALTAYAHDIDGYYQNMNIPVDPEKPSWRLFADMLLGARVYE